MTRNQIETVPGRVRNWPKNARSWLASACSSRRGTRDRARGRRTRAGCRGTCPSEAPPIRKREAHKGDLEEIRNMKLRYRRALADLEAIQAYIAQHNPRRHKRLASVFSERSSCSPTSPDSAEPATTRYACSRWR